MPMRNKVAPIQWPRSRWLEIALLLGLIGVFVWFGTVASGFLPRPAAVPAPALGGGEFNGTSAFKFLEDQLAFGPRPVGSEAAKKTGDYIIEQLKEFGWATEVQEFTHMGVSGRNIIAKTGTGPVAILGAHYDTRKKADRDPDPGRREEPILGANDGASGVAVLLELARTLDRTKLAAEVWLVFFDAEDNGGLEGWEFSVGSEFMAANLSTPPTFVVVVDMVGDANQDIFKEGNSTPELMDEIWRVASSLGYEEQFIPKYGMNITDDHVPFLRRGYPAVDVIDFNYPYWHTTQDTVDKVSAVSLERVGRVLKSFLEAEPPESFDTQNSNPEEQPE